MTRTSFRHLFVLLALLAAGPAWASVDVTLAWDANPASENVAGYTVSWGTTSHNAAGFSAYDMSTDVGNALQRVITLPDGAATYYFAVQAYNGAGLTSDYSTELVAHALAVSVAGDGTISPSGTVIVIDGADASFTLAPDAGTVVDALEIDGGSVGALSAYTLSSVDAAHTVTARFAPQGGASTYTVSVTAGANGIVSPSGTVAVVAGGSVTFSVLPDVGYDILDVQLDGGSLGNLSTVNLSGVASNHTLSAWFVAVDGDGNGIVDTWEIRYFGTTGVDPGADPDGDGVTNAQEFTGGSDPTVADFRPDLTPAVWEPASGGTVSSSYPVLSVMNPVHDVGTTVTYEFELGTDPTMADVLLDEVGVEEGALVTGLALNGTLVPGGGLVEGTRYYWRARATDGDLSSPWTPVCTFVVDSTVPATTTVVDVFEPVVAADGGVVDSPANGSSTGVQVDLPPGILPYDFHLVIGTVDNPPAARSALRLVGKVYEFGPHGVAFQQAANVLLPYSDQNLADAGIADPADLGVYTYDTDRLQWEEVAVAAVDYATQRVLVRVDHFSMYALGKIEDGGSGVPSTPSTPSASGGGGGGGCFIGSLW